MSEFSDGASHASEPKKPISRSSNSSEPQLARAVMFHPLFDHSTLLPTKSIEAAYKIVKCAVLLRETGSVFTAQSGMGKTDALERIKSLLRADFPGICVFRHDAHNHQIASIRAFFKHFLHSVGQEEQKGETYDLRSRLIRLLVDEARISGLNIIVMLIDEANAMLTSDFLFLKDVYNDLSREGVQLVTILMGQDPELLAVIKKLQQEGRKDLIARFAMQIHWLRGFSSVDDLQFVLREIDQREYPARSGKTWTEFFTPHAWQEGLRLEHEAQPFYDAIVGDTAIEQSGKISFPARPTFLAIRRFLFCAAEYDCAGQAIPDTLWSNAVSYAKLQEAVNQTQDDRNKDSRRAGKEGE